MTLDDALAAFHAEMAKLTPDEQIRINYALTDLLPLLVELAEGAAHPLFAKIPVVGQLLEAGVDRAIEGQETTILALLVPQPVAA
jgi:hypothetical protein